MYHIFFGHAEHSKFVVGIDVLYVLHCHFSKGNLLRHVKVVGPPRQSRFLIYLRLFQHISRWCFSITVISTTLSMLLFLKCVCFNIFPGGVSQLRVFVIQGDAISSACVLNYSYFNYVVIQGDAAQFLCFSIAGFQLPVVRCNYFQFLCSQRY